MFRPSPNVIGAVGAALAGASLGFARPIWFISAGYGAAMSLQAALTLARHGKTLDTLSKFHSGMVALYGVRLGGFLLQRDYQKSYQKKREATDAKLNGLSLGKKIGMWLGVSTLYALMYAPTYLNALMRPAAHELLRKVSMNIGAPLMALAFLWETLADFTKQESKKENLTRFCDSGPFKYSIMANYAGEVGFWWGSYLTGLRAYQGPWEFVFAAVGVAGITSIILSESKRRIKDMDQKYKDAPGWKEYRSKTPLFVPIIGKKA